MRQTFEEYRTIMNKYWDEFKGEYPNHHVQLTTRKRFASKWHKEGYKDSGYRASLGRLVLVKDK
jgi:hypothetical protein